MDKFSTFFDEYCNSRGFSADPQHHELVLNLEQWKNETKGWYIWGDVGRGKSTIAKAFYEFYPNYKKKWFHFTDWLITIQQQLALYSDSGNLSKNFISGLFWQTPIEKIAKNILQECEILFLDEFSLHHIADAIIVQELLSLLLKKGLKVITTSNTPPDFLYENGLNRDRLVPFFMFLKKQLKVVKLQGEYDFRHKKMTKNFRYFLDKQKIESLIDSYFPIKNFTIFSVTQGKRTFEFYKTYNDIAVCSFNELCSKDRSLQDYQVLFHYINTLFLYDLPKFNEENTSAVKRFIILIDFLYEKPVHLFIHGQVSFEEFCRCSLDTFPLKRTFSRLIEMLSKDIK